ncbi:PDZ domain-containing protein [Allorhodopirellula solitaria]|uniref:PDZ domain-containing protein n=1 Tax=Allorhodopirellula solitaria TaxID=2527987 RepID=UPI001FE868BA|nr:PDZ domain-containing protein [Allorhodopirellula solitaria]
MSLLRSVGMRAQPSCAEIALQRRRAAASTDIWPAARACAAAASTTVRILPALFALVPLAGLVEKPALAAADIYVSPSGSDANEGASDAPVQSIARAKTLASQWAGTESVTVHVADGVYSLPETVVFTAQDSGTEAAPVVYQSENEGGAVISGGTPLDLTWEPFRDGIFMAKTEDGLQIDQLFVGGQNQRMARYPNFDSEKTTAPYQGFAADAFSPDRAARWKNPAGGYIHAMHRARWGGYHYLITGKNSAGEVTYEGGWQNNRQMGMHEDHRMVENIFEELDAPGEWYHDASSSTLYYMPEPGMVLADAMIEVVRLRHLIEFRGSESSPVQFVTLQGFTFRHAARTFMETKEPLLRSDWTIYRGGGVVLEGTQDVSIEDCHFDQLGGNAIFISNYNRRAVVKGCHIHDCGASGVCWVGDPDAVRNPLFEYRQTNDLAKIDRTPGPRTNNYPADSIVEDCLIHAVGSVERQPAGVQISMSRRITVRDCSIYDCARAGINIGDGTWGGHLIERNDVFQTVQETGDHGSFNSWGRDRYWRRDQKTTQAAVDQSPELPLLDAVQTTVLRNNRFRCDHGWDIDLDDGSSNYHIYNNLMLNGGLKLREGFHRRVWNNITVNNGLHPHVWYNDSGDEVFGNIFMHAPKAARMPTDKAKGKRVDENLYYSNVPEMKSRFAQFGWDVHSIVADPKFVDPEAGDFRVAADSPAKAIGFQNFATDHFGVKKPALRSIAETPQIPTVEVRQTLTKPRSDSPKPRGDQTVTFFGAKVRSLTGDEFSAYGVSKSDGGVAVIAAPRSSVAAAAGLTTGDLIQAINRKRIRGSADLAGTPQPTVHAPLTLTVIRDQNAIELKLAAAPMPTLIDQDTFVLDASDAYLHNNGGGTPIVKRERARRTELAYWTDEDAFVQWSFRVEKAGTFEVLAELAVLKPSSSLQYGLPGNLHIVELKSTGSYTRYKLQPLGQIELEAADETTLRLQPDREAWNPINLRAITLRRVQP